MSKFDVIVIGGGHNGLTTAALLAGKGEKVIVLEKRDRLGGLGASEEFHPGYKTAGLLHDTSCVCAGLIKKLRLKKYGLQTTGRRAAVSLFSDDGRAIILHSDIDESVNSISRFSQGDALGYRNYRLFIDAMSSWIDTLMKEPQPSIANCGGSDIRRLIAGALRLRLMGQKRMLELLKIIPMSVADFLNEQFETDFLKAGMAFPSILASFYGPLSAYTTMNLILWESMAKEHVIGGPVQLVGALENAARENGVEIRSNAEVINIELNHSGEVIGVVLSSGDQIRAPIIAASCSPKQVFLRLLASNKVGVRLESEISHLRARGTIAKVNLALCKKVQWKSQPEIPVEYGRLANDLIEMEMASDAIKYGRFSEKPILDIYVPTVSNQDLAPAGHEVVSILAQYVPYSLDGGWTDFLKNEVGDMVVDRLAECAVNLKESIVAREVLTPQDIESRYSIPGGHVLHIEHAIDQLIGRPVPGCAQYKTPVPGLFLCGSGSHPGGGLTGIPGVLASKAILSGNL